MNQKGQGLIEALIALGAAVIIVAAITVAVITAVGNSDFAKYQNLATGFAQQGMEIVQQKGQLNWDDVATYSGTWCLPQGTTDFYSMTKDASCHSVNVQDKFFRQVDFTKIPPNCKVNRSSCCVPNASITDCTNPTLCPSQVAVTVKWTDGKCSNTSNFCHKVVLDSCITDIYRTQ